MSEEFHAICYLESDYASMARRIGAALTDLLTILFVVIVVNYAVAFRYVPMDVLKMPVTTAKERHDRQARINEYMRPVQVPLSTGFLVFACVYHIGLRRLPGGTLGYRLMGVRLVNEAGAPPEWKVLVKRFLLAVPFVSFFGVSYLLCRQNPRRQAFHDRWSGTWVVRKSARPLGPANRVYQSKLLGTFPLTYIDLEPAPAATEPQPEDALHA